MIWDWFANRVETHSEACAVIGEEETWTYADLAARADAVAGLIPEAHGKTPARVVLRNFDACMLHCGKYTAE